MHAFRHQPSEALMSLCQFRLAGERIRPRQVEPPAIYTIRGRHHLIQTPLSKLSLVSTTGELAEQSAGGALCLVD